MEQRFPNDPAVRLTRAVLLGRQRKYDEALALIDSTVSGDARLGPNELLEKGRLLDQSGRYDEAWAAFAEGKRLARELSGQVYLDAAAQQQIDRLRTFFTSGRLRLIPRATVRSDAPQPIFILGFPRSGTTLVEQTLSAHPKIAAGDELPLIHEITAIMPRMLASPLGYPEALAELWMGDQREGLDNLRDYYLQKVRQMGVLRRGAARFTDKMPLNETHLGLIALLFPEAPLIHVLRHPLDIMVSAFSNAFTHGFYCASDLPTAAKHYVRVMDLVQHYRGEMTLRYLPIRYEDIVVRPAAKRPCHAGFRRREIRQGLPDLPREPPLCPHRQLRTGRGAAVRPLGRALEALSRPSGAGDPGAAAGDRAAGLHAGLTVRAVMVPPVIVPPVVVPPVIVPACAWRVSRQAGGQLAMTMIRSSLTMTTS